jgi:3-methylfumaryl-CoA hydratase
MLWSQGQSPWPVTSECVPMVEQPDREPSHRTVHCDASAVRRVAAMLDLDPDGMTDGELLPRGWHFILLGAESRRSDLRADGFPGFGVPMPDLGLPRLLIAGRTVEFNGDIVIGALIQRTSFIKSITRKTSSSGPMAVVTVQHELRSTPQAPPAVVESQTFVLLAAQNAVADAGPPGPMPAGLRKTMIPDETLLFQFSALGFNSHKIHIDRDHARKVEGLPDLVVNGGLTTLLLTELLRTDLKQTPARITARYSAPLFCHRPMTLAAEPDGSRWRLGAFNDMGRHAADVEVDVS